MDVAVEPEEEPLRETAPLQEMAPQGSPLSPAFPWWRRSPSYLLLLSALLLNVALFLYLLIAYQRLPAEVALHFNEIGQVDRVGAPSALFILPLAGAVAWITNGFVGWLFYHRRQEQPIALIIWGATVALQLVAWGAVLQLTGAL